jgi:hypothetical protein
MLPDPAPDKKQGGPRQVSKISPNSNLGDHQFVGMGMTKQIGDIAATPQRVELTADGDLKLVLRAKNMSANTAFDPIHEVFVRYSAAKPSAQPYSFLETKSHKFDNIYGAYLSYGNDEEQSVLLRPGQETTITLKTYEVHRHIVAKISESAEPMVWRVQLRRGLVKWKGKDVSTTTVFGVEFTTAQIDRTKKDA